jgi:hypothetical protein
MAMNIPAGIPLKGTLPAGTRSVMVTCLPTVPRLRVEQRLLRASPNSGLMSVAGPLPKNIGIFAISPDTRMPRTSMPAAAAGWAMKATIRVFTWTILGNTADSEADSAPVTSGVWQAVVPTGSGLTTGTGA